MSVLHLLPQVLLIIVILLFALSRTDLSSFAVAAPPKYRVRINNSMRKIETDPTKNVQLDFGAWKNGAVRRNMILASSNPSEYSNCIDKGNRISIGQADKLNREKFVNDLAPQLRKFKRVLFGFFHPYCNAGGGGEKVLWKAVETTLSKSDENIALIYTGDNDATSRQILENVSKRFDYDLDKDRIVFIFLNKRRFVDSKMWPHFTLLGQALGSILLTFEAIFKCPPDVWCDTMGYPFGYPIVRYFAKIPIVTYTHYPVISSDMLNKLRNTGSFKSCRTLFKYCYWQLFMLWYKFVGSFVSIAITNSSWTCNHMRQIWSASEPKIIYPPCSTEKLIVNDETWTRKNQAIVIAQFRPEKRHELIIRSFAQFLETLEDTSDAPKLILIGSTRSQEDRDYVTFLNSYATEQFKIPKSLIEFHTDCPYIEIKKYLKESSFGINAMWNEHFGIAVVEYVASGLIPLVHASAGPLLDIVVPWDTSKTEQVKLNTTETRTGFFFKDKTDPDFRDSTADGKYPDLSELFVTATNLTDEEKFSISKRGRECVLFKFSDLKFNQRWTEVLDQVEVLLQSHNDKKNL